VDFRRHIVHKAHENTVCTDCDGDVDIFSCA
jgi:hypothetical protein